MKNLSSSPKTYCKFSAKNYKNLDPIKMTKRTVLQDQNVNILPNFKINYKQKSSNLSESSPLSALVGSKLLSSVKDLRKSIKNLININDEEKKKDENVSNQERLNKKPKQDCDSYATNRHLRTANSRVPRKRESNLESNRQINSRHTNSAINKPVIVLNEHKYLDFQDKRNSPKISKNNFKSSQLLNEKQNNIIRILNQNLNDEHKLKIDNRMGIRHTSKFGESNIKNSQSVYDYSLVQSSNKKPNCSLLKYSTSYPVNIETEIQQQITEPKSKSKKRSLDINKNKLSKIQERHLGATNRFSVQTDLYSNSKKSLKKNRSNSFDGSSNNNLSNLIISKALVVQEFTPSPYDTNSLCLKVGDIIDVIDMNETGIWTGILNDKIGKFKFIYVKIIETLNQTHEAITSIKQQRSLVEQENINSTNHSYKSSATDVNKKNLNLKLDLNKINKNNNNNINKFKSISYGYLNLIRNKFNTNLHQQKEYKLNTSNRFGSVPVCARLNGSDSNKFIKYFNKSFLIKNQTIGYTQTDKKNEIFESNQYSVQSSRSSSESSFRSLKYKVNFRSRANNMGQKQFKSSGDLFNNLDQKLDSDMTIKKKPSSVSSGSTTSSKSKSNHYSHISNDSGCYSAIDRYSSPSDSSVIGLNELKTRTLTRKVPLNRNSVCDSIILSCSSSDSSINVELNDDSNKKAQLLCDQLNQILSLSTNFKQPEPSEETKFKPNINRSQTFNSQYEKCQRNVLKNLLDKEETNSKKSKISNFVKTGRKLFAWNQTSNSKFIDFADARKISKNNEKLCDLIAAKLLSENIELAKEPFTDEMGFCKVPLALVKRYAFELNQDLDLVSKCIESERLAQIEKYSKLGIPNDFMYKQCKCKKQSELLKWKLCKCDINMTNLESFLTNLGLPMYIEMFNKKNIIKNLDDLKKLIELNDVKQFELAASITNPSVHFKSHYKVISSALIHFK